MSHAKPERIVWIPFERCAKCSGARVEQRRTFAKPVSDFGLDRVHTVALVVGEEICLDCGAQSKAPTGVLEGTSLGPRPRARRERGRFPDAAGLSAARRSGRQFRSARAGPARRRRRMRPGPGGRARQPTHHVRHSTVYIQDGGGGSMLNTHPAAGQAIGARAGPKTEDRPCTRQVAGKGRHRLGGI